MCERELWEGRTISPRACSSDMNSGGDCGEASCLEAFRASLAAPLDCYVQACLLRFAWVAMDSIVRDWVRD